MPDARSQARDAAVCHFWRDDPVDRDPYLFALLDCARDPAIYPQLCRLAGQGAEVLPIYQGQALTELASVAPYLVGFGAQLDILRLVLVGGLGRVLGHPAVVAGDAQDAAQPLPQAYEGKVR